MTKSMRVVVIGPVGTGKSHVMHTIEKALLEEYGETIQIGSSELEQERRQIGHNISEWQRPTVESINIHEMVEVDTKHLDVRMRKYQLRGEVESFYPIGLGILQALDAHLDNALVNPAGSTPSIILSLGGSTNKLNHLASCLDGEVDDIFGRRHSFTLEDVALSGTLFANKVSGKVLDLRVLNRTSTSDDGARMSMVVQLDYEPIPPTNTL